MTMLTVGVCNEPGCPFLTTGAKCERHERTSSRNHYGVSRHARGLDAEYLRMREIVLAEEPICQLRFPGCTTIATTADHILPRVHGGPTVLGNLRASCAHCNMSRGARL